LTQEIVFLVGGLLLLFAGGEALVRGSVALADRLQVSKLFVGIVVVGFGTSSPELLVSVQAALTGSPDIAVGNVVGSNIANVLLIVGIAALLAPLATDDPAVRRDAAVAAAISAGLVALFLLANGTVTRLHGIALLAILSIYLTVTFMAERARQNSAFVHEAEEMEGPQWSVAISLGVAFVGIVMLVFGARTLVEGAVGVARAVGVSEAVIGLTVVAIGTSLPELATAIVAAVRRHTDVVLANIVGSNIFNILAILGVTAVITPIPIAARFAYIDAPVMAAIAIVAAGLMFLCKSIGRIAGLALLLAYAAYLLTQGLNAG